MLEDIINRVLEEQKPTIIEAPGVGAFLLSHKNLQVTDLADKCITGPQRIEDIVTLHTQDGFLGYVNRFKTDDSVIFITPDLSSIGKGNVIATAVIDYHQSNDGKPVARWNSHIVKLMAAPSLQYQRLLALHDKLLPQDQFAKELQEIARFSSSHSAGDLLDIARTLKLTSSGKFQNYQDDFSGSVDFAYSVQVKASAGFQNQNLTVPSEIVFTAPVLEGGVELLIPCDFIYRIPDGPEDKMKLGLRIKDKVWIEKEAIESVAVHLEGKTQLMTLVGSPS